jgi:hypothetical protein
MITEFVPTNEQLAEKLQDLIAKHNLLVQAVDQLSQSIEHINEMLFAQTGEIPPKSQFDS